MRSTVEDSKKIQNLKRTPTSKKVTPFFLPHAIDTNCSVHEFTHIDTIQSAYPRPIHLESIDCLGSNLTLNFSSCDAVNLIPSIMQPTLPPEIIDIIVDHVGADAHTQSSRNRLRALALVSAALLTRAYWHLFHEIHLVLSSSNSELDPSSLLNCERKLTHLRDVLVGGIPFSSVAMVHHIQSARISFVFEKKKDLMAVSQLPQLSGILDALHGSNYGITSLKMDILDFPMAPITFKRSYPIHLSKRSNHNLYEAFISLCYSQRLTTIHLKNFAMYLKELCGTNIEELHLEEFMFTDEDKYDPGVELDDNAMILQLKSLALVDVRHGPSSVTKSPPTLLTKVAHAFHPSLIPTSPTSTSLPDPLIPLVFSKLTTLTLQDDDLTTQLPLFPALRTLRVLQNILWMRRTMGFMTKLPQFFLPLPGVVRPLGSAEHLVVETDINFREIFLDDNEDVRLWDAWDTVDAHLTGGTSRISGPNPTDANLDRRSSATGQSGPTSGGLGLQIVHFIFRFRITPGRHLSYQQEPAFLERNRRNLFDRFPLLVSDNTVKFKLDVLVDRENMMEPSVRCKGPGTGWW